MKTFIVTICALTVVTHSVLACMAAPVNIMWFKPKGSTVHYSVEKNGHVTIVDAKDNKKVLWTATLENYSQHGDQVKLVKDGTLIVCIHGNHRVNKLSDAAIDIIAKDGTKKTFKANEFIAKLQPGTLPGQPQLSIAPQHRWMQALKTVDGNGIEIVNALKKTKKLSWN